MTTEQTLKLKPETTEKIRKIDSSILYWSLQLGQAMMRLREVEAQVGGLYDFKKATVLEDVKSHGIDAEEYDISTVDPETVLIKKIDKTESKPPSPPFEVRS